MPLQGQATTPLIPRPWEKADCECSGSCGICTSNFGQPAIDLNAAGVAPSTRETGVGAGAIFVGWPAGIVNELDVVATSGVFAPHAPVNNGLDDLSDIAERDAPLPREVAESGVIALTGPRLVSGAPPLDVDLYVATTLPDDDAGHRNEGKCDMEEWTGCNLVRLRLRSFPPFSGVASVSLDIIQRMDEFGGRSWPSISPDGRHLAYIRKGKNPGVSDDNRLYVRDLQTWDLVQLDKGSGDPPDPGNGRPVFPAWYGELRPVDCAAKRWKPQRPF